MSFSRAAPTDFLLPFLRLPAIRLCVGMTTEDGAYAYSEDLGARALTQIGSPTWGCTDTGVPYVTLNGTTQCLSVADAAWNKLSTALTVIAVAKATSVGTTQAIVSKYATGGNLGWQLSYNTSPAVRFDVTVDGATAVGITNGAPTTAWITSVARFTPSAEIKVINSLLGATGATNVTAIPATIFNSVAALEIGRNASSGGANYFGGSIALVAIYNAILPDAILAKMIDHCHTFGVA